MPYQIKSNKVMPPVYITSLEIMNKVVPVGSDKLPLSLSAIPQLDLGHDDTMFSLSFAALSYCSPAKNQYAYMLEGFDADWIYVGAQHKATYTNIPAGEYVFRVKATNNDGLFSCVGCGRCLAKCPIQMNIVKVMKKLGGYEHG